MRSRVRKFLFATTALMPLGAMPALANPLGPTVVNGNATVQGTGTSSVTVNQSSSRAIINWNTFNIGTNESTKFVQPDASSVTLNRVTSNLGPSLIDGLLTANGKVFIVNGDGILFGKNAVINTGSLLATTSDIKNSDFMGGRYVFGIPGRPDASIVNLGNITAASGGFAALVAPGVRNSGTITATLGTVALSAGNVFNLDFYGDKLINLAVNDQIAATVKDVQTGKSLDALVKNEGALHASGGRVQLTASAVRAVVDSVINTSGTIEANSVGVRNGVIVLSAATGSSKPADAPAQVVRVSGTITAAGQKAGTKSTTAGGGEGGITGGETGGKIMITGEKIALAGAQIDASGPNGGGTVLIGGDWSGGHPQSGLINNASAKLESDTIPTATTVSVDAASKIDVSATAQGNGGKAIVWADGLTIFNGSIAARGGPQGGDGGFVETSGHQQLVFNGTVDTLAPKGKNGVLLLDPQDLTIDNTTDQFVTGNPNFVNDGSVNPSHLTVTTLQNALASSDVTVTTNNTGTSGVGNIIVANSFTWSTGSNLTLSALNNITVNNGVVISNTGSGNLTLRADNSGTAAPGNGTVNLGTIGVTPFGNVNYSGSTGKVSILYDPNPTTFKYSNPINYNTNGGVTVNNAVPNQSIAYMLVNTAGDLQSIGTNSGFVPSILGNNFALGQDITAGNFTPIGSISSPFTGRFNGFDHTISGLIIAPTGTNDNNVGMFAAIGNGATVNNLTLNNVSVTANQNLSNAFPGQFVGTLAGSNAGTIDNVHVTGNSSINGLAAQGLISGGLVGQNGTLGPGSSAGHISNSSADVAVTLGSGCGFNCSSRSLNIAGGLVGSNTANSTITGSSASGDVIVGSNAIAGGLVGQNGVFIPNGNTQTVSPGTISDSSASGNVSSTGINVSLGGFAGNNSPGSVITNGQASGDVTANANLPATVNGCNNSGNCDFIFAGAFVGQNSGTIQGTGVLSQALQNCGIGFSCATGNVSVGSRGQGAGFAASNDGIINMAFATGNVTGAHGYAPPSNGDDSNLTVLSGFVGLNQGRITNSFAFGDVGSANVPFLRVSGFVSDNVGTVQTSFAIGNVRAGDNSHVGGFAVDSGPFDDGCNTCTRGDGFNTEAKIENSFAFGNVTAGKNSLVGGFASSGSGTFTNDIAFGSVTGGGDSLIGGFIAANGGTITNSSAFGAVTGTGPNSVVAGFAAFNGGNIDPSVAGGPVTGTSNSVLAGFAGINFGTINQATTLPTATVTGTGSNNMVGGLVGLNFGSVSNSTANNNVTSGDNSVVAGLVAANAVFTNFSPNTIPGSSFPKGTVTNSTATGNASAGANSIVAGLIAQNGGSSTGSSASGTATGGPGSTTNPQVAQNSGPSQLPANPSILQSCNADLCTIYETGILAGASPPQTPPPTPTPTPTEPAIVNQSSPLNQVTQLVTTQDPGTQTDSSSVVTQSGGGGGGTSGGGGNQGKQGNKKDNKNSQLAGLKPLPPNAYPMAAIGDKNFTGVPPLNEIRFQANELVMQSTADQATMEGIFRQFRLTLLSAQRNELTGRTVYRVRTEGPVRDSIITIEQAKIPGIITTPNYNFIAGQAPNLSGGGATQGDASQYVIEKLHLTEAHRLSQGNGILIAVIDSQVDERHPELDGEITERFDSLGSTPTPHPHGTGMAGAIVSHQRLLGIAPGARLLTVRAFGPSAAGAQGTTAQILAGLDFALSKGARIVNMSFAGPPDPMLREAIKRVREKGVLLVAAAGNAGPRSPPLFPGADSNVIAVTATDTDDHLFSGANRGKYVSVAAPGVDIMVPAPDGDYQFTTGTSVAAAHVTGVAALLWSRKPDASADVIRDVLLSSAKDLGPKGRDDQFGWGLVDPLKALQLLDAQAAPVR